MAKITVAATTKNLPFIYIRQNIRKCSHVYSSIPLTVGHFNKWKMLEKVLLKISIVVSRLCLCNLYVIWYQKGNTYTMTWEIFWFKSKQKRKENNRIENNSSVAFFDGNHNILFMKYCSLNMHIGILIFTSKPDRRSSCRFFLEE